MVLMATPDPSLPRCGWVTSDPLYLAYHDDEWGVPVDDDRRLFEMINLEGAQAGLSWITILKKRESYRRVFEGFDPERLARWGETEIAAALADPGIVRNRAKVSAVVGNARAFLDLVERQGRFRDYLWGFLPNGETIRNQWPDLRHIPAATPESTALSKDLKKKGFRFVGPTIAYAFMQAVGMVDDHVTACFKRLS